MGSIATAKRDVRYIREEGGEGRGRGKRDILGGLHPARRRGVGRIVLLAMGGLAIGKVVELETGPVIVSRNTGEVRMFLV